MSVVLFGCPYVICEQCDLAGFEDGPLALAVNMSNECPASIPYARARSAGQYVPLLRSTQLVQSCCCLTPTDAHMRFRVVGYELFSRRRKGKRVSSVMEGGQEVLKRESMGRRFKGELRDLVERIHSTEVLVTSSRGIVLVASSCVRAQLILWVHAISRNTNLTPSPVVAHDVPQVQYILCIRPNMENDPVLFEDEYVTQQLLSASIVEAAQVCAAV